MIATTRTAIPARTARSNTPAEKGPGAGALGGTGEQSQSFPGDLPTRGRIPAVFVVRAAPDLSPPIISAEEAWSGDQPYSQDSLALDFDPDEVDFGRLPTRSSMLPAPHPVVTSLAQAVIEVMAGQRPAPQLLRHTTAEVYAGLARRATVSARRQYVGGRRPAMVRRVRVCEPADGVVEGCAVVVAHGRVRALALRLEGLDGRWVVTALTIG